MDASVVARWQDWSGRRTEHLVVQEGPDGIRAEAVLLGAEGASDYSARYRILCDPEWRTRRIEVSVAGGRTHIDLSGDGTGRWTDAAGARRRDLDGAIDVDISATPFTNSLPIRRLRWRKGASAEIAVVFVQVPELTVTIARQRYTCLEPGGRYRFESIGSDFVRDLEVDERGLVLMYPGLFRRVS